MRGINPHSPYSLRAHRGIATRKLGLGFEMASSTRRDWQISPNAACPCARVQMPNFGHQTTQVEGTHNALDVGDAHRQSVLVWRWNHHVVCQSDLKYLGGWMVVQPSLHLSVQGRHCMYGVSCATLAHSICAHGTACIEDGRQVGYGHGDHAGSGSELVARLA